MSTTEEGPNPYELLELTSDATDADIRKAYRQKSLKVHPDRVCGIFTTSSMTEDILEPQ